MVKRCAWGRCNSDSRYPERLEGGKVKFIPFPKPTKSLDKCLLWIKLCDRPQSVLNPDMLRGNYQVYICTKHFVDGSPSDKHPDPVPAHPGSNEMSRAAHTSLSGRTEVEPPKKKQKTNVERIHLQEQDCAVLPKIQDQSSCEDFLSMLDVLALVAERQRLQIGTTAVDKPAGTTELGQQQL